MFTVSFNGKNKKVLIFTAFSDTAEYLYSELSDRIHDEYGLNVAMITGSTDGMCTIKKLKPDFNTILTLFSPISKEREVLFSDSKDEIDVLIATDCISEGQNLHTLPTSAATCRSRRGRPSCWPTPPSWAARASPTLCPH